MGKYLVETDGGHYQVETEDAPNPIMEGAKSLASGVERGGLGVLQTAENMQKGITGKSSNFQGVIDQAKQNLPKTDDSIQSQILQGAGEFPGVMTQVEGMGGGVPGMAAQAYLSPKDATTLQRVKSGGIGALLGSIYSRIGGLRAAPEAGDSTKLAALLGRMGLGGLVGAGATKLQGGTNDQATAQGILGGGMSAKAEPYTNKDILKRGDELQQKGYKLSSELVQPNVQEQSEQQQRGLQHPAVEQFYQNAEPGSDFGNLSDQMNEKAQNLMNRRNEVLKASNKPQSREYLSPLFNEIENLKSQPQTPRVKTILEGMQEVYDAEVENLNKNGDLDSLSAEARKEWHGRQQRIEKGFPGETSPGSIQAHDLLRDSLRSQLEESHPEIKSLNEPYGGLLEAGDLLGKSASKMQNTPEPGKIQKLLMKVLPAQLFYENPGLKAYTIAKELATLGSSESLNRQTGKIKNLRESANRLFEQLPQGQPDEGRLEPPLGLPAPPQKQLPGPEAFRTRDIKEGRLLQGSPEKPTINIEGPGPTINMPEYLDSDLKALAKKYGVSERNIRSIINEADIPKGVGKASEQEGLIQPKKVRNLVDTILKRRKQNFG